MLTFERTVKISNAIKNSLSHCQHPSVIEAFSKYSTPLDATKEEEIPYFVLKQLLEINPDLDLLDLIKGSRIILQVPPKVVKSDKLLAILKECQDIVDKKEYYRMTKGLDGKKDLDTKFKDVKFTIGQVSSIFNVVFSMISVFAVIMYFGDQVASLPIKVLIALFASWIVGIAEGYFLFRDLLEIQDQESKIENIGK